LIILGDVIAKYEFIVGMAYGMQNNANKYNIMSFHYSQILYLVMKKGPNNNNVLKCAFEL